MTPAVGSANWRMPSSRCLQQPARLRVRRRIASPCVSRRPVPRTTTSVSLRSYDDDPPGIPDSSRLRRVDGVIALLLLVLGTLSLAVAGRSLGFTRDEGYYFTAAENHVGYLEESLQGAAHGRPLTFANRQVIDRWLGYNSEHPPLLKTCSVCPGGSCIAALVSASRAASGVISPSPSHAGSAESGAAMRLPTQLLGGALAAAVYLFAALCLSRFAGLVAAALTLLQPRLFFTRSSRASMRRSPRSFF